MFITHSSVIAKILTKEEAIDILSQEDDFFSDFVKPQKNKDSTISGEDAISF